MDTFSANDVADDSKQGKFLPEYLPLLNFSGIILISLF